MINQVYDRIFIGNADDAKHLAGIPAASPIDIIFNTAIDLDIPFHPLSPIKYIKMGLIDGGGNEDIAMKNAIDTLQATWRAGGNILVHCFVGASRSPSVVAGFLSQELNMPLEIAFTMIAKRRDIIEPKPELIRLIRKVVGIK